MRVITRKNAANHVYSLFVATGCKAAQNALIKEFVPVSVFVVSLQVNYYVIDFLLSRLLLLGRALSPPGLTL
jgi:hypothetical protein